MWTEQLPEEQKTYQIVFFTYKHYSLFQDASEGEENTHEFHGLIGQF